RLVPALQLPDIALFFGEPAGLAPRELAGLHALLNALTLIVLALVDARIARAMRICLARAHRCKHAGERQHYCGKLLHCRPPEKALISSEFNAPAGRRLTPPPGNFGAALFLLNCRPAHLSTVQASSSPCNARSSSSGSSSRSSDSPGRGSRSCRWDVCPVTF